VFDQPRQILVVLRLNLILGERSFINSEAPYFIQATPSPPAAADAAFHR
jgi:hypothetical protein